MQRSVVDIPVNRPGGYSIIVLGLGLLMLSQTYCASERSSAKTKAPIEPVQEEERREEADVDIERYLRDDFTLPPTQWEAEKAVIDTSLPFEFTESEPDTTVPSEDQETSGWRVQIYTSDNFDSASAVLEQVRLEFPETGVYLVYEAPYHRIRLGDAQNIADAEVLLRRIQQMGYPAAFRVPSQVYLYPELRMQNAISSDSLSSPVDTTDFEAMPGGAQTSP